MKIATFGDQKHELEAVNLVELSLTKSGTDFKTTLNAFAVPHICNDLQGQDLGWVKKKGIPAEKTLNLLMCALPAVQHRLIFFVFCFVLFLFLLYLFIYLFGTHKQLQYIAFTIHYNKLKLSD